MMFQYNFFKNPEDPNLYYCDVCGAEIFGSGKVELFYWTSDADGHRHYTKIRCCEDCNRQNIKDEINGT